MDVGWEESPFSRRFELKRRLGEGGFGVVFHAYDRERGCDVALKTLRKAEPAALYRLKREFRSLADISHPSLVNLYELLSDRGEWLISMELIDGVDFIRYVRGLSSPHESISSAPTIDDSTSVSPPERPRAAHGESMEETIVTRLGDRLPQVPADIPRLRHALRCLVEGLLALHREGKLHRDIKPSNVLVTREGRVAILDFGLVADRSVDGHAETQHLAGTPLYMAPEQAAGEPVSEASDWYAVGVMLFEALVGQPPFTGTSTAVTSAKRRRESPLPSSLVRDVPQDLDELCRDLLNRRPEARPLGVEVLRRLGFEDEARVSPTAGRRAPFVGRDEQLRTLRRAFRVMERGEAAVAFVHGSSGMGKTALVQRYLERLERRHAGAVVLTGRCYERESVPYKAVDSLVDSLMRYLGRLPRSQVESLLPRDVLTLARLFPVLRGLDAVAAARRRVFESNDPRELRRRAFLALRGLLARLAERAPVVMFIDDLQWGDEDSAALLVELLRPPDEPAVLLICSYRSEEVETSAPLRALLTLRSKETFDIRTFDLEVGEFSVEESGALARELLEQVSPAMVERADSFVAEAAGSPFFLEKLVTAAAADESRGTARPPQAGRPATLESVLREQIARLAETGRRLMETLAVVGRPATLSAVAAAAGVGGDLLAVVAPLSAGRLVRTRTTQRGEEIEVYHDRIRVTVASGLAEERLRETHRRLFETFSSSEDIDAETLAVHAHGAGDVERAAYYAAEAALRAADALAFDRAARLFRLALELNPRRDAEEARGLRLSLAGALVNAGRGAEAAEVFLAAVEGAAADEAVELRRLAAQHYLMSGHLDEGMRAVRDVLAEQGMSLPSSPRSALLSILLRRIRLRLRGLGYQERPEEAVPADTLRRIDACWTVGGVLFLSNTIFALDFQNRGLLLALRAGEPVRVARALALELVQSAAGGSRTRGRTEKVIRAASAAAKRANRPLTTGLSTLYAGCARALQGDWKRARELSDRAHELFREDCTGVAWELDNCHLFSTFALQQMGELRELAERFPPLLRDAEERGDLFMETYLQTDIAPRVWLADNAPDKALTAVERGIARWPFPGYHRQHQYALRSSVEILLYDGKGAEAWSRIEREMPALRRSLLLRTQMNRILVADYRARSAIAAAGEEGDPGRQRQLRDAVAREARRILRERTSWGEPLALMLRASLAAAAGNAAEALELLSSAEAGFEAAEMGLHTAVASIRRGELVGGDEGQSLAERGVLRMKSQGIVRPHCWTRMLCPGDWTGAGT